MYWILDNNYNNNNNNNIYLQVHDALIDLHHFVEPLILQVCLTGRCIIVDVISSTQPSTKSHNLVSYRIDVISKYLCFTSL